MAITIVALPKLDDKVNRISSEKAAHLTICYLGEVDSSESIKVVEFVQHAASQLSPFGLSVERRGKLGPDDADVVFFEKKWNDFGRINEFRGYLLKNDAIQRAYNSVDQYPEWTPHVTLGWPDSPANEDESDYPGIHYVDFDRIAVWVEDSSGPEFLLKYDDSPLVSDSFYMSGATIDEMVGDFLKHYGKKGMKWGVRKDEGHEGERVKLKKLDKLDKKWEKSIYTTNGAVRVHNAMAEHFNSRIGALNDKHPDANLFDKPDSPESKAYVAELEILQSSSYSHAVSSVHGSNPSGTKRAVFVEDEQGARIEVRNADVQHAEEVEVDLILLLKRDAQGRVTEANKAELELAHSNDSDEFFAHYGVKGMRWGVTTKDRAAEKTSPREVSVTQKKPGKYAKAKGGDKHPLTDDATRALAARQKAKKSTTDALTNQELKAAVERMQLEQRYKQLEFQSDRRSVGARFVAGLFGKKRYDGKDLKFEDEIELSGERTRDAAQQVAAALKKTKAA